MGGKKDPHTWAAWGHRLPGGRRPPCHQKCGEQDFPVNQDLVQRWLGGGRKDPSLAQVSSGSATPAVLVGEDGEARVGWEGPRMREEQGEHRTRSQEAPRCSSKLPCLAHGAAMTAI